MPTGATCAPPWFYKLFGEKKCLYKYAADALWTNFTGFMSGELKQDFFGHFGKMLRVTKLVKIVILHAFTGHIAAMQVIIL